MSAMTLSMAARERLTRAGLFSVGVAMALAARPRATAEEENFIMSVCEVVFLLHSKEVEKVVESTKRVN